MSSTTTEQLYNEANLDRLYDQFAEITPQTVFVTLTNEEKAGLVELAGLRMRQLRKPSKWYKEDDSLTRILFHNEGSLASRIDAILGKAPFHGECFMKTNTFSPKDYNYFHPQEVAGLYVPPKEEDASDDSALLPHLRLDALEWAKKELMKVASGKRAVDMLVGSPRIISGIRDDMESADPPIESKVALRQWTNIPNKYEFRVFAFEERITGITQSYFHIFYPELVEQKELLHAEIVDFVNAILTKLQESTCFQPSVVMDIGKTTDGEWILIEFNPFRLHPGVETTAGLFDWERDYKILCNTKAEGDVEMRIQTMADNDSLKNVLKNTDSWPPIYKHLLKL